MPVYGYWEGTQRHWYYDLCWQTVRAHNPSAVLLDRQAVEAVIGPLPEVLDRCYVIHKVDWIRKRWIHAVGGWWLDLDFICLSNLQPLVDMVPLWDFVGYHEWSGYWMDHFFGARAGSPILAEAADYALRRVERNPERVGWLETNAHAIDHAIGRNQWGYWCRLPTHLIQPVFPGTGDWFISEGCDDEIQRYAALGWMTSYHALRDRLADYDRDSLLRSHTRLGAILRRALAAAG